MLGREGGKEGGREGGEVGAGIAETAAAAAAAAAAAGGGSGGGGGGGGGAWEGADGSKGGEAREGVMKGQQTLLQTMEVEGGREGGREGGVVLPCLAEFDLFGNACGSRGVDALCVCLRWRYGEGRGDRRGGWRLVIDLRMNRTTAEDGKKLREVMVEGGREGERGGQVVVRAAFV